MPAGRPKKYKHLVSQLNKKEVYTPASIARLDPKDDRSDEEYEAHIRRIRHSLARFTKNKQFPIEGDGTVFLKGQSPQRGWFGWRWQQYVTGQIDHSPALSDQNEKILNSGNY